MVKCIKNLFIHVYLGKPNLNIFLLEIELKFNQYIKFISMDDY
jgi:hypothetical protein